MKFKKQLLIIPAIAVLGIGTTLTFANNEIGANVPNSNSPELVENEEVSNEEVSLFANINGTVKEIIQNTETIEGETSYTLVLETEESGDVWIITNGNTVFIKNGELINISDIEEDDNLIVSYESMAPALSIYPPRINATAVVVANEEYNPIVHVDVFFTEGLISSDETLTLSINEETVVVDINNNVYEGSLENKKLAVIFTASTRSIPAIPLMPKIIVLGEADEVFGFDILLDKFNVVEEVQKPIINMVNLLPPAARGNRDIYSQQDNNQTIENVNVSEYPTDVDIQQ